MAEQQSKAELLELKAIKQGTSWTDPGLERTEEVRDQTNQQVYLQNKDRSLAGVLSRRLMGASFTPAGMAPRRYERIASAGPAMGILEYLLVRAYLRAGAALPKRMSDQEAFFGRHQGGATYLLEEGVAEHVVKVDVASLYPSIIRTFRISPRCDPLDVFLHLIDHLTELRLFHKAAAREAPPGSMQANQHEGTQDKWSRDSSPTTFSSFCLRMQSRYLPRFLALDLLMLNVMHLRMKHTAR
ncbi:MAG TPA: hypothetical protein VFU49_02910 [Ktedonobacteraceae bacterium]|nr:hypothetical protein [Ktedonobacteraceae bacterium]